MRYGIFSNSNFFNMSKNKHRMIKREEDQEDLYVECWSKFFDINNVRAPITTSTSSLWTTARPTTSGQTPGKFPTVTLAIGGAVVLVFLVCVACIGRMVVSNKNERKRRKQAEAEYNVMKTTLTSITDTEDGTTYAEVAMGDPTYRDGHIELPSRKQRHRLEGVSNGLTQTMKRFFSVEGNQPSTAQPYAAAREPTRRDALPPIPEAGQKSNSFPRAREQSEKRLSYRNPEYEEIGPDFLRRSNVYDPLDKTLINHNVERNPYEALRKSTLTPIAGSTQSLPKGATGEDNYFIVEKEKGKSSYAKVVRDDVPVDGAYFIVEKDTKIPSSAMPESLDSGTDSVDHCNPGLPSPKTPEELGNECSPLMGATAQERDTDAGLPVGDIDNNYFLLEKNNGVASPEGDYRDYVKPVEKQRNSYIDILPEHSNFMEIKKKAEESKLSLRKT